MHIVKGDLDTKKHTRVSRSIVQSTVHFASLWTAVGNLQQQLGLQLGSNLEFIALGSMEHEIARRDSRWTIKSNTLRWYASLLTRPRAPEYNVESSLTHSGGSTFSYLKSPSPSTGSTLF